MFLSVLVGTDAWNSCRDLCLNELYYPRTQRHFLVCPFSLFFFFSFTWFHISLASARVLSMFLRENLERCSLSPLLLKTLSSPCQLLLLLLEIVVHVSVISFKKPFFFSFLLKKMFFDYFDRNECCCSAKIWSVVIKQTGFRCMSLGSCEHVSEYRFVSPRLWHVQTSTHIHKMMVIRRKSCCTVLQNVVNIAACTRFQSYIYIYVHTLCTLYYCHCRLRSCHIDRETWCCAFFSLFSAPFFFLFLRSWRKNVSVLPDQNCHVITTLSSERTRIPCGYEKKKYKVYCLIFLCVDIMTENCEK